MLFFKHRDVLNFIFAGAKNDEAKGKCLMLFLHNARDGM